MSTPERFIRNEEDVELRANAVELAEDIALNVLLHKEERDLLKSAFEEIRAKLKEKGWFSNSQS